MQEKDLRQMLDRIGRELALNAEMRKVFVDDMVDTMRRRAEALRHNQEPLFDFHIALIRSKRV